MFQKYRLNEKDKQLLNRLLEMKDWNAEDGYKKEDVIRFVNSDNQLDESAINQIRNYVIDKNLEYGFENDEPNELGYETEEFIDKLLDILEGKHLDIYMADK